MWLENVKSELGNNVNFDWRSFSLEQVNNRNDSGWKAWEQGPEYDSRGIPALHSSEAARHQGRELHNKYIVSLLEAKHVNRADIRQRTTLIKIAEDSCLDIEQFKQDLDDPELLTQIGRDHETAAELGIFGTPTYVFEKGKPAFLKMFAPAKEQSLEVWNIFVTLACEVETLGELKRPQPPWPKGIFNR